MNKNELRQSPLTFTNRQSHKRETDLEYFARIEKENKMYDYKCCDDNGHMFPEGEE